MKNLALLLMVLVPMRFAIGQSIHITSISKYQACKGETIKVYYTAAGSFAPDNIFFAQISDEKGSFAASQNNGQASGMSDSIVIVNLNFNMHFRIRVFSTDPFTVSDTSSSYIDIYWPQPHGQANLRRFTFFGWIGFAGDSITFFDGIQELPGTTYHWKFNQDSQVGTVLDSSVIVSYPTTGWKTGALTVADPIGCDSTDPFRILMLSCDPIIPDSAHIVTGTESGTYPFVWVKAGGNYTNLYSYDYYKMFSMPTIYVEPGGTVTGGNAAGIYYLKDNASFVIMGGEIAVIILNKKWVNYSDTIYCPDLQFDYSQVGGGNDVHVEQNPLQILNSANGLQVHSSGMNISASVVNLLGTEIFSKSESDMLSLDLSSFTDGVYFAIITCGTHREIRKIAVIH